LIHLPHCHQSRSRQWQDRWRRLEPLLRRGERCDGRLSDVRMLVGGHNVTQKCKRSSRGPTMSGFYYDRRRTCDECTWTPGSEIGRPQSCALSAAWLLGFKLIMAPNDSVPDSMTHQTKKKRVEDQSFPTDTGQRPLQLQRRRVWRACEGCRSASLLFLPLYLLITHFGSAERRSNATGMSQLALSAAFPDRNVHGYRPRTEPR
jgi:hypothetical protein